MARHAGYSPRSFARRFRAETGTTPLQWLIARRVARRSGCSRATRAGRRGGRGALRASAARGVGLRQHFARALADVADGATGGALRAAALSRCADVRRAPRGVHATRRGRTSSGPATSAPSSTARPPPSRSALRERVIAGELPALLLLLEHPAVYTLGRRSEPGDLPFGADFWRARGIDVVQHAARRQAHLPRARASSSATRSCTPPTSPRSSRAMEDALVAALAEEGIAARGRDHEGPAVHRRVGRGPQDRLDRRARLARRDRARLRGQRRQRRRAVPPGHRLRAARRADDVGRARDRRAAALRLLPQARRLRLRAGPRAAPADRHARAAGRRARRSSPA